MLAIRNYTNTVCDVNMAKTRLNILLDRKESLYCRYFSITANIANEMVDGGKVYKDKMADYLHELHKVDMISGKSLEEEINEQLEVIRKLERYIKIMEDTLKELTGVEAELYNEIVMKNTKISNAVEKIANKYNKDVSTIWRLYNKKLKKDIKMLVNCK